MEIPHNRPKRLKMIEEALKETAPKSYRRLKRLSQLENFLNEEEAQMMESYWAASGMKGPKLAWEKTLAKCLEFSDLP